jgi:IS5 family transposase
MIKNIFFDRGYKGAAKELPKKNVYLSARRNKAIQCRPKRRAAIELTIGHMKADHRMDRNFLRIVPTAR